MKEAMEAMPTMWPFLASSMAGRNSLIRMKWEIRLILKSLSRTSSLVSRIVLPVPIGKSVSRGWRMEKGELYRCQHC